MKSFRTAVAVAVLLAAAGAAMGQTSSTPPSQTLTVAASGDIKVVPDLAVVQLGVTTRGLGSNGAQTALLQNNMILNQVLAAWKQLGLLATNNTNVQTSNLSLNPVYNQPRDSSTPPMLIGFDASDIVSLTLSGDLMKQVGPAIDAGVGAGANQVQGISFQVSNDESYREQALTLAGNQARAKAAALASGLGVTLGPVQEATEVTAQVTPVYAGAVPAASGTTSTPVLPGQVTVHVDIQVRFGIM